MRLEKVVYKDEEGDTNRRGASVVLARTWEHFTKEVTFALALKKMGEVFTKEQRKRK